MSFYVLVTPVLLEDVIEEVRAKRSECDEMRQ